GRPVGGRPVRQRRSGPPRLDGGRRRQRRCQRPTRPDPGGPVPDRRAGDLSDPLLGRRARGRRHGRPAGSRPVTARGRIARGRIALGTPDPRDLDEDFAHRRSVEVRFADTDAMGHVNNAVYLTFAEAARVAWWSEVTGETIIREGDRAHGLILAEAD